MSRLKYLGMFLVLSVVALSACGEKPSEEELREQAKQYEQEENYEQSIQTLERHLEEYPNGEHADEALQKLAFLNYNNLHDYNKAIEYHKRLIEEFPESKYVPQARFMIGFIYANELKDYDVARHYYMEFLDHHPDNELVESVEWEVEHLGEDINSQLSELFGDEKSNGQLMSGQDDSKTMSKTEK